MNTARTRIEQAATEHGWIPWPISLDEVEYRRGRRHVFVTYSVRGSVTTASTASRRLSGGAKTDQILAELAR